jgi:hypothetical protein
MSVCCDIYFQVEVSATGRSFVQRSPTEFGVSECVSRLINKWIPKRILLATTVQRQVIYVKVATEVTTHSAFNKLHLVRGCGPFYGETPHPLLWALQRAARGKITVSGIRNRINFV